MWQEKIAVYIKAHERQVVLIHITQNTQFQVF